MDAFNPGRHRCKDCLVSVSLAAQAAARLTLRYHLDGVKAAIFMYLESSLSLRRMSAYLEAVRSVLLPWHPYFLSEAVGLWVKPRSQIE